MLPVFAVIVVVLVVAAAGYDWWARRRGRPERATAAYWEAARAERREMRLRRTFFR